MIGGTVQGKGSFAESMLALPRHRHDEKRLKAAAMQAPAAVGSWTRWPPCAPTVSSTSELRFMEIARSLMLHPLFLLLDEPAAGLSADERRLGALIKAMSCEGTGVLLVEHHADLIFDIRVR